MAHPAVALLESALASRKLDRTLTSTLPSLERSDPSAYMATDVAGLDECLHGGVPRGELSEIAGPRSSGRTSLLLHLMAAATARGELVALVDTCDRLDVSSVAAAGVVLDRMLWVRGDAISGSLLADRTVDRALKALNLILQAGGFGVVALDLADVPPAALRRLPFTTWLRVHRAIEGRDTACVLVTPEPLARSAGGLTLSLTGRATWAGEAAFTRRLDGVDLTVRVVSPRRRVHGDVAVRTRVVEDAFPAAAFAARGRHTRVPT